MKRNEITPELIIAVIIGILITPIAVVLELTKDPKYSGKSRRRRR